MSITFYCLPRFVVTSEDHEAEVRIKMAEAERNGIKDCRTRLEWTCRKWGMSVEEIGQCETFADLLDAFEKMVTG